MRLVSVLGVLVFYVITTTSKSVTSQSQQLMLILLDGFRWDYVEKYQLPNFKRFYSRGVKVDKLLSDFPTLSLSNYYSITTGLFTESHGITGNSMWDRTTNDTFSHGITEQSKHRHFWEGGWPVWVSVEKQQKVGYTYYWIGADVNIHNSTPTRYIPFTVRPNMQQFKSATTDGLAVLNNGTADFVAIFYEDTDWYGHRYGADSEEMNDQLKKVDDIIKTLVDGIEGQKTEGKINLMVVSDHGMTDVSSSRVINLTTILTPDLYDNIMEDASMTTIYLKDPSLEDKVFNLLHDFSTHMTVYRRKDIPEKWHYKHGRYVPLIVCVADLGWYITQPLKPNYPAQLKGDHGYDNYEEDMRGIFFGMGPYFKAGESIESARIVDLYNVMCGILGITPRPNNGTIQTMTPLLKSSADSFKISSQIGVFVIVLNVIFIVC